MSKEKINTLGNYEILGHEFNIYGTYEEPLFLAKDVAEWIGHSDVSMMLKKIDEDEKVTSIVCTLGGNQSAWFLTENGMYEVLMQSRKPIAKSFKKEVKTILKEIRKNGGYLVRRPDDTPEQIITRALNVAAETLEQLMEQNQRLKSENDHYQSIFNTKDTVTTTEMASKFGMSAKKLNKIIEEMGIQYRQNGRWFLYEAYKGLGLTDDKTYTIGEGDEARLKTSMHWTPKGIEFISNQLQKIKLAK